MCAIRLSSALERRTAKGMNAQQNLQRPQQPESHIQKMLLTYRGTLNPSVRRCGSSTEVSAPPVKSYLQPCITGTLKACAPLHFLGP